MTEPCTSVPAAWLWRKRISFVSIKFEAPAHSSWYVRISGRRKPSLRLQLGQKLGESLMTDSSLVSCYTSRGEYLGYSPRRVSGKWWVLKFAGFHQACDVAGDWLERLPCNNPLSLLAQSKRRLSTEQGCTCFQCLKKWPNPNHSKLRFFQWILSAKPTCDAQMCLWHLRNRFNSKL